MFLMDKVILSVSGMAQTSSPSSSLCYSQGSHWWFALSFQGFIPGFWERGGWKGRGSRRTLPRLPAPAEMCCSLQLMQQDNYVLPCRKSPCSVITGTIPLLHGSGHGERALRHLPVGGRDPCLPSSLRDCHSFRAGALKLIWDEERVSPSTAHRSWTTCLFGTVRRQLQCQHQPFLGAGQLMAHPDKTLIRW